MPSTELSALFERASEAARTEKARKNTVLSYWSTLLDGVQYSPQEFYRQVQDRLAARNIPDLLTDHLLMRESHRHSAERLYFQMRRQRLVFEICASPFGSGFFISERYFDRTREARWTHYVATFALLLGMGTAAWAAVDGFVSVIIVGTVVTGLWSLMRLAATSRAELDERLCAIPLVGRLYESCFHPDTYFRQDQAEMYRKAVHRAVLEAADNVTTQKGIRALTESERQPVLRGLQHR